MLTWEERGQQSWAAVHPEQEPTWMGEPPRPPGNEHVAVMWHSPPARLGTELTFVIAFHPGQISRAPDASPVSWEGVQPSAANSGPGTEGEIGPRTFPW